MIDLYPMVKWELPDSTKEKQKTEEEEEGFFKVFKSISQTFKG